MTARRRKAIAYLVLGLPPHVMGYVVLPVAIATRTRNRARRPPLDPAGLPFVAAGAALIGWAVLSHYRASSDQLQFTPSQDHLATNGAYAYTRNPLYVGGAAMWTGWALLFRSPQVATVGALLFSGLAKAGVPFEERMLERKFGPQYDDYRRRVPRFVGRVVS